MDLSTAETAIILAAGRGSRLGDLTDEIPKCLVRLGGRSLLEWQMEALTESGVQRIVVVCGYQSDTITALGVETVVNPNWENTNMVASLLCAKELIGPSVIVSYSDIVYVSSIVKRLKSSSGSIAITYDLNWMDLWSRRFTDPLSDAETFRLDAESHVAEIGKKPAKFEAIQGQYMGLLKIDEVALDWIEGFLASHSDQNILARIDMTGLLSGLVEAGHPIEAVPVNGGWCEIDSQKDLEVAEEWLAAGRLGRPRGLQP